MLQAEGASPVGHDDGMIQAVEALGRLFQNPRRLWFMSYLISTFPFLSLPGQVR